MPGHDAIPGANGPGSPRGGLNPPVPRQALSRLQAVLLDAGDIVADRYTVIEPLGVGTAGAVYRVRDKKQGADRALKIILPSLLLESSGFKRIQEICRRAQTLNHPALAKFYDFARDPKRGVHFIVSEYVAAEKLTDRARERRGVLEPREALDLAGKIAETLDYLHGFTPHLGLKPDNVFVLPTGGIKLTDAGLATLMTPIQLQRRNAALGTIHYLAPEQQYVGKQDGPPADYYSLGVIMYELLTGETPLGQCEPPSELQPRVPKQVDLLVLQCLAHRPENRPNSAGRIAGLIGRVQKKRRIVRRWAGAAAAVWGAAAVVFAATSPGVAAAISRYADSIAKQTTQWIDPDRSEIPVTAILTEAASNRRKIGIDAERPKEWPAEPPDTSSEVLAIAYLDAISHSSSARAAEAHVYAPEAWQRAQRAILSALWPRSAHAQLDSFREASRQFEKAASLARDHQDAAIRLARLEVETRRANLSPATLRYAEAELAEIDTMLAEEIADRRANAYAAIFVKLDETEELARERLARAWETAGDAKKQAELLRNKIAPEHHARAASAVKAGEAAWNIAHAADDGETARERFEESRRHFARALVPAPEPPAGEERVFDGFAMSYIPAGSFRMGPAETVQRKVTLTRGFWMGQHEITKAQWISIMGTEPWLGRMGVSRDPQSPAVFVSWQDAQKFIQKLNARTGAQYALPTEAQWEYACRAGSLTTYGFADTPDLLDHYAWYRGNTKEKREAFAHRVGKRVPNAWGLYDMHGNVWEWCSDWYGPLSSGAATDPTGPSTGSSRVERGGGWSSSAEDCRSASRFGYAPGDRFANVGFRLVRLR